MNALVKYIGRSDLTIEDIILDLESREDLLVEASLKHYRGDNLYVREAHFSKESVAIGRVHKYDHVFILIKGRVTLWSKEGRTTYTAPTIIESKSGTQRVAYFREDSICMNIHGCIDDEFSNESAEEMFTVKSQRDYLEFINTNILNLTHDTDAQLEFQF
jgi:hypothetical protein